jgi:hypothetical protein
MKKSITKIGVLAILGLLMFATSVPSVFAYTWHKDRWDDSLMLIIDDDDTGDPDDTEAFAIAHDDSEEILLIVLENGGKVGIGEDDPDLKLEVVGSSGEGYFGVSSAKDNDGDIFIIDSSGNVGIGVVGGESKLNVLGGVTVGLTYAGSGTAPSGGMIIEGNVGIGITNPTHKLTIQSTDDDTLQLIGPDGINGYGARITFGNAPAVYIEEDTDNNLYIYGHYRTAIMGGDVGIGTTTPGAKLEVVAGAGGAASIGISCSATGLAAIATGYSTDASAWYSTAMGYDTTASGTWSTAMGKESTASNLASTAMGLGTTANGEASTAMGVATTASGGGSIAMGDHTTASGDGSTAMGSYTTASGIKSTAMGNKITADGDYSFGIGLDTTSRTITQDNTMAIMGGNVGIGTVSPTASLHVNGDVAFSKGIELEIYLGVVSVSHTYHTIDTYYDDISDDLDTINGGVDGQTLIIRAAHNDRTVVVKDDSDNIQLNNGDFHMNYTQDTLVLIYDADLSAWLELSRSDNHPT